MKAKVFAIISSILYLSLNPSLHAETEAVANPLPTHNFAYPSKKMAALYNNKGGEEALDAIFLFNNWFRSTIHTQEELTTAIAQLISHFYNNLRQCIPGKYRYFQPNLLFGLRDGHNIPEARYLYTTSIIYGIKEKHCIVENIVQKKYHPLRTICYYSPESLNFYTDEQAKAASINDLHYQRSDLTKIEQIANECKVIPSNQPLS